MNHTSFDGKETINIKSEFSEDLKNEMREEYIDNVLKADKIQHEISLLQKQKKFVVDENKALFDRIISGFEAMNIEAVFENDYDTNMRYYFDAITGEKVHERKLKPSEHQIPFLKSVNL